VFAIKTLFMKKILIFLAILSGITPVLAWGIVDTKFVDDLDERTHGEYWFFEDRIQMRSGLLASDPDLFWWVYAHEVGHSFFRDISFYNYYDQPVPADVFPTCDSYITEHARLGGISEDAAESFAAYIFDQDSFYERAMKEIKEHNVCLALKYLAVARRTRLIVNGN